MKHATIRKEVSKLHKMHQNIFYHILRSFSKCQSYRSSMLYSSPNPKYCIIPQQADVEKKKLEDRGRVEKDKKKYARLVEDCKQKTERQKIALSEVVKAQKELILANSEVGAQFFC